MSPEAFEQHIAWHHRQRRAPAPPAPPPSPPAPPSPEYLAACVAALAGTPQARKAWSGTMRMEWVPGGEEPAPAPVQMGSEVRAARKGGEMAIRSVSGVHYWEPLPGSVDATAKDWGPASPEGAR